MAVVLELLATSYSASLQRAGDGWADPARPIKANEGAARGASVSALPSVTAHGMGDSCFNSGMKQITELIGSTLGTYAVCVPTGESLQRMGRGASMLSPLFSASPSFGLGICC